MSEEAPARCEKESWFKAASHWFHFSEAPALTWQYHWKNRQQIHLRLIKYQDNLQDISLDIFKYL